jgi:ferredoxin
MPRVSFLDGKFIDVATGTNLMSAIIAAERPIGSSCGALGICAKCFVQVLEGADQLSKPNPIEKKLLEREKFSSDTRISCQTKVLGDVKITTTYW